MSSPKLKAVEGLVKSGVEGITKSESFSDWLSKEDLDAEGLVVINNSFIYRDLVKTSKNQRYLCLPTKDGKIQDGHVLVAKPTNFNTDFKFSAAKSKKFPQSKPLDEALEIE